MITIPFGKYNGKSVERVATQDCCYLTWLLQKGIRKPELDTRIREVLRKLDNFVPVVNCSIDGCTDPGYFLSIVFKSYGFDMGWGLSADTSFAVCSKEHFYKIPGCAEEATLYPTKFLY